MKSLIPFLLISFAAATSGHAQLLNKLKQKAESGVNKPASTKQQNTSAGDAQTESPTTVTPTSNKKNMDYPFTVLPDAKFYFSTQPFANSNAGAKTNFTSQDFIYGRVEFGGKTLSEVFKLDAQPVKGLHYLNYGVLITQKDKEENAYSTKTIAYTYYNRSRPVLIKEEELKNTWLNFDVLPEPAKNTTLMSVVPNTDRRSDFKFPAVMIDPTRETFPASGDYTVQLLLWNHGFDDWGKIQDDDKSMAALGTFDYQFSTKDVATLQSNEQKREDDRWMAEAMKNKYTRLPDWWHEKTYVPVDPLLKAPSLTPMIKNYCSRNGYTYISHKIWPGSTGGWSIYTDSQTGLPVSRRHNAEAWTLYKDEQGRCRFAMALIDEQYAGAGTYGSPYISGLSGEFIDCSAIK